MNWCLITESEPNEAARQQRITGNGTTAETGPATRQPCCWPKPNAPPSRSALVATTFAGMASRPKGKAHPAALEASAGRCNAFNLAHSSKPLTRGGTFGPSDNRPLVQTDEPGHEAVYRSLVPVQLSPHIILEEAGLL